MSYCDNVTYICIFIDMWKASIGPVNLFLHTSGSRNKETNLKLCNL